MPRSLQMFTEVNHVSAHTGCITPRYTIRLHHMRSSLVLTVAVCAAIGSTFAFQGGPARGDTIGAVSPPAVTTKNPCVDPGGRVQPTAGFDPNTASAADLVAQDFPPRPLPNDTSSYPQAWKQYVSWYLSGQVYQCLTSPVQQDSGIRYGAGGAWSGYFVNGQTWLDAQTTTVAPYTTGAAGTKAGHWPGVNVETDSPNCHSGPEWPWPTPYCTDPLVQGGVEVTTSGACNLWFEADPLNSRQVEDTCDVGDTVTTHVKMAANGVMSWHIVNLGDAGEDPSNWSCNSSSPGSMCNPPDNFAKSPDGHAEWITEPKGSPIPNFGSVYFKAPQAYSAATGWKYLNQVPNATDWIVRLCGNPPVPCSPQVVLVAPGGTDGFSGFTNTWYQGS